MNHKIIFPLLAAVAFTIVGCATEGNDTVYVQPGDKDIVTGKINIQDYAYAANAAVTNLLRSGVLDKVSNPPAMLLVSRIVNETGQQIETDLLTGKITTALNESGKAWARTTDPAAIDLNQKTNFLYDTTARDPDFTLSGKIIETIDRAGNTTRYTYTFQLSLNDTKTGYQVWEGEKEIGKQGTRPETGW